MSKFCICSLLACAVIAIDPVSDSTAQEFVIQLQPTSPSDRPAELIPPAPSIQVEPQYEPSTQYQYEPTTQYPSQNPYIAQKPYVVQKLGVVCPNYCVSYHHHGRLRRSCCGYCVPTQMLLSVQDPIRCGCAADICISIPSCCQGMPHVHSKVGLLGRGIVTYKWPSGYMVEVVFKKMSPDVMVHTIAR